jgi:hypothetical protein
MAAPDISNTPSLLNCGEMVSKGTVLPDFFSMEIFLQKLK